MSLSPVDRRQLGAYYTPDALAKRLAAIALRHLPASARIADPACGDGAFLIGAAEALLAKGASVDSIVSSQLFGADVDPQAVRQCRRRLVEWASRHAGNAEIPESHLLVEDALGPASRLLSARGQTFDAVIGNPPFGSQLRALTSHSRERRAILETSLDLGSLGYVDTAGLFLVRSLDLVRVGGVVSMILPTSLLAARDGSSIRSTVAGRATLEGIWVGGDSVGFDAAVSVWAPILTIGRGDRSDGVARYLGQDASFVDLAAANRDGADWVSLVADLAGGLGGTNLDLMHTDRRVIGDVAVTSAGFRRHFYGLAPFVREASGADPVPRLVTTGAIDPLRLRHDAPVRFAGKRFDHPTIDLEGLAREDRALFDWVEKMRVPKVLVASQAKVLEAVVDPTGDLVPSTPVVAVVPRAESDVSIDHLGALLVSPIASAVVHERASGSGMTWGQCRVSASLVESLPLPAGRAHWDRAADAAGRASSAAREHDHRTWDRAVTESADAMVAAFGIDEPDDLLEWWNDHRPPWRDMRRLSG